jgi:ProP effector
MAVSRKDIDATIELLCERFPQAFIMFERKRIPLKIGVHDDIITVLGDAIDLPLLGAALRFYTSNFCYRRAQKQGAARIDLDGNASGTVSEADALSAARDVASRRAALTERQRSQPPVTASPASAPETPAPSPPPPPRKDGLAALREAAKRRREAAADDQSCAHAAGPSERQAASQVRHGERQTLKAKAST